MCRIWTTDLHPLPIHSVPRLTWLYLIAVPCTWGDILFGLDGWVETIPLRKSQIELATQRIASSGVLLNSTSSAHKGTGPKSRYTRRRQALCDQCYWLVVVLSEGNCEMFHCAVPSRFRTFFVQRFYSIGQPVETTPTLQSLPWMKGCVGV